MHSTRRIHNNIIDLVDSSRNTSFPETPFSAVLSNPPYQDVHNSAVFHLFQQSASLMGATTSMIYPGEKWMSKSGKGEGLDEFTDNLLTSPCLSTVVAFQKADKVFPTIEMQGGLTIVCTDSRKDTMLVKYQSYDITMQRKSMTLDMNEVRSLFLYAEMTAIVSKVMSTCDQNTHFLSETVLPVSFHQIGSNFIPSLGGRAVLESSLKEKESTIVRGREIEKESIVEEVEGNHPHNTLSDALCASLTHERGEEYVRVFANDKLGTQGRGMWFLVPLSAIPRNNTYDKYITALSSRNTSGDHGKSQQATIFRPGEFFADSRFGVGTFDTYEEAQNFLTWMSTDVVRTLIISSSRRVKNFGLNVPLMNTYRGENAEIDFSQGKDHVNRYLVNKYGLDEEDEKFMKKLLEPQGSFYPNGRTE